MSPAPQLCRRLYHTGATSFEPPHCPVTRISVPICTSSPGFFLQASSDVAAVAAFVTLRLALPLACNSWCRLGCGVLVHWLLWRIRSGCWRSRTGLIPLEHAARSSETPGLVTSTGGPARRVMSPTRCILLTVELLLGWAVSYNRGCVLVEAASYWRRTILDKARTGAPTRRRARRRCRCCAATPWGGWLNRRRI